MHATDLEYEAVIQVSVKSVNEITELDSLVITLFVYSTLPRLGFLKRKINISTFQMPLLSEKYPKKLRRIS